MTDYILDLIRMMLAGLPVYILARYLQLRRRAKRLSARSGTKIKLKFNKLREFFLGLFVIFMIALLVFVWQGEYGTPIGMLRSAYRRLHTGWGINLVPFHTIRSYYRVFGVSGDLFWINIIGNILMFIPWGFGLLFLWKKNRRMIRLVGFSAMLPVLIEASQLFINRQVDVDDFILNFAGGLLGGLLFLLLAKLFPKMEDAVL